MKSFCQPRKQHRPTSDIKYTEQILTPSCFKNNVQMEACTCILADDGWIDYDVPFTVFVRYLSYCSRTKPAALSVEVSINSVSIAFLTTWQCNETVFHRCAHYIRECFSNHQPLPSLTEKLWPDIYELKMVAQCNNMYPGRFVADLKCVFAM